jgi:DNA-directed RNA polymerase specialized sigma24 family protein
MSSNSVTGLIPLVQAGDEDAARRLWERFFHRLIGMARGRLWNLPGRVGDEEDVVLSVLYKFIDDAQRGRLPPLGDRNDLWNLLAYRTARKCLDLNRRGQAQRRGGPEARSVGEPDPEATVDRDPTPEFAAELADECRRRLAALGSDELRTVAVMRMQGYDKAEIAARLGCVLRTVERRLEVIRSLWSQESRDE